MKLECKVFNNEELPAFKVGDGVVFATPQQTKDLTEALREGEKDFDNEIVKGHWAGPLLMKFCYVGTLLGRSDDSLTVGEIRGPNGEPPEKSIQKVAFNEIIGVLQKGKDEKE